MIDFTAYWTIFGKYANAGNTIQTAAATTIEDEVEDAVQALGGANAIEFEEVREGVRSSLRSMQNAMVSGQGGTVRIPVTKQLIQVVTDDNVTIPPNLTACLEELILQMNAQSKSLDVSVPACTPTYDGSNTGNGVAIISVKRGDGLTNEHILGETISCEVTAVEDSGLATVTVVGEGSVPLLNWEWPKGSGTSTSVTSHTADTGTNLVLNGQFDTADASEANLPSGWVMGVATPGTTLKMTSVEVQTVIISGTPTAGSYLLSWVNAASKTQTTVAIPYNGSQDQVQTALQSLDGLEEVTVVTTGTSPDFTHTITFTGVPNPAQLTNASLLTGGAPVISHGTTTAGSAFVLRGARSLEFDGDGAQLTAIHYALTLTPETQYLFNVWAVTDSVPAAGVMTIELVDGIGGTVIADEQSTNNSTTIDCTALTTSFAASNTTFRTPKVLPPIVYLTFRLSTALSNTSSVHLDDVLLVPMDKLYAGGISVSFLTGTTEWVVGDKITLPVTNDRGGALHEWANRTFALREKELLFPTNSPGTEQDSLIS